MIAEICSTSPDVPSVPTDSMISLDSPLESDVETTTSKPSLSVQTHEEISTESDCEG